MTNLFGHKASPIALRPVASRGGRKKRVPKFLKNGARTIRGWLRELACPAGSMIQLWPHAPELRPDFGSPSVHTAEITMLPVVASHAPFASVRTTFPQPKVHILEGALYLASRNVVLKDRPRRLLNYGLTSKNNSVGSLRELGSRVIVDVGGPATIFRSNSLGFAHTLIDDLPRMALIGMLVPQAMECQVPVLYSSDLTEPEAFAAAAFLPPSMPLVRVEPGALHKADHLLVPSLVSSPLAVPDWYHAYVDRHLAPQRPRRGNRRLFITRSDAHRRRILNEDAVVTLLASAGFEVFDASRHSFIEQLTAFYDASVVVAPHGAGLANTMFSRDLLLVELFPQPYVHPHFYLLGANLGIKYKYVLGTRRGRHDDFECDISELTRILRGEAVL